MRQLVDKHTRRPSPGYGYNSIKIGHVGYTQDRSFIVDAKQARQMRMARRGFLAYLSNTPTLLIRLNIFPERYSNPNLDGHGGGFLSVSPV